MNPQQVDFGWGGGVHGKARLHEFTAEVLAEFLGSHKGLYMYNYARITIMIIIIVYIYIYTYIHVYIYIYVYIYVYMHI